MEQPIKPTPLGMIIGRAGILVQDYETANEADRKAMLTKLADALTQFDGSDDDTLVETFNAAPDRLWQLPPNINALMSWLTSNTINWTLECDPHATLYESRSEYLEFLQITEFQDDWFNSEHLYEARAYPSTPVGFVLAHGTSAYGALEALVKALS